VLTTNSKKTKEILVGDGFAFGATVDRCAGRKGTLLIGFRKNWLVTISN
jgi:hypothetical protein